MEEFEVGDKVSGVFLKRWIKMGVVDAKQPAITWDGVEAVGPRYHIHWDDGDELVWLSALDLKAVKE